MENNKICIFEHLLSVVDTFLKTDVQNTTVLIDSGLRYPLRTLKQSYPRLYYFAFGVGTEYSLYLSKTPFNIDYFDLTFKSKKLFLQYTGLKIDLNLTKEFVPKYDPTYNLTTWFELLSDALLAIGCEKDFPGRVLRHILYISICRIRLEII